jgi:hypothetical protein
VRHVVFGHRLEQLGKSLRKLGEIDVAVGIDEHG